MGALAEAIEALSETPWSNPWKLKILLCIIILHPCLNLNSCESSAWASWPSLVQVDESALKGVRTEVCTVAIPFPYLITSKTLISLHRGSKGALSHRISNLNHLVRLGLITLYMLLCILFLASSICT